jgi:hypothetical protein
VASAARGPKNRLKDTHSSEPLLSAEFGFELIERSINDRIQAPGGLFGWPAQYTPANFHSPQIAVFGSSSFLIPVHCTR